MRALLLTLGLSLSAWGITPPKLDPRGLEPILVTDTLQMYNRMGSRRAHESSGGDDLLLPGGHPRLCDHGR